MSARFDVQWDQGIANRGTKEFDRSSSDALERVLELANLDAPYLTGAMVRSSRVVGVEGEGADYAVEYGVPYALRQHQNRRYRHTHGRAGWLRDAVEGDPTEFERLVASQMRL